MLRWNNKPKIFQVHYPVIETFLFIQNYSYKTNSSSRVPINFPFLFKEKEEKCLELELNDETFLVLWVINMYCDVRLIGYIHTTHTHFWPCINAIFLPYSLIYWIWDIVWTHKNGRNARHGMNFELLSISVSLI